MKRKEYEEKRCELMTLKSKMFTPVDEIADYNEVKYLAKFLLACKEAGLFEQIHFEEPFDFAAWETEREATRARIRELQKELDESVMDEDDNADK